MSFWRYLVTKRDTQAQLGLAAAFVVAFAILASGRLSLPQSVTNMWQAWIELGLAAVTVIVAVFIWYNEKRQDWENDLPKRLYVSFCLGDTVFYRIENAPLVADGDVRAWGQQLGQQMNDNQRLSFRELAISTPRLARDSKGAITLYELTIRLQEVAKGRTPRTWRYDDDGRVVEEPASPAFTPAAV